MRHRPPPTAPKIQRPGSTIYLEPPALVIICEGKTEAMLLDGLRKRWRISKRSVHIEGGHGDPSNVIHVTIDRMQRGDRHIEACSVFDRDDHHHWTSAIDRARALGITLAVSNPCIELWGILLHRDQTAHIHRHDAQRRLKSLHPGYDHARNPYLDLGVVLSALGDAERRCSQLRELALANGDPHGNPSSSFSEVVSRIRARAKA